jgi:ribosomal protein S2
MDGTVTISLDAFKKLEHDAELGVKSKESAVALDRETSRLLLYLSTVLDIKKVAAGYNALTDSKSKLEIIEDRCRLVKRE